jgi:hypothetical protein
MNAMNDLDRASQRGVEKTCRLAEELFLKVDMIEAMRRFYTADARYITPEHKVLQGREQIAEYIKSVSDAVQASGIKLESLITRSCGPGSAYVLGNGTILLKTGEKLESHYLCIFREQGGEWLCETEMSALERLELNTSAAPER